MTIERLLFDPCVESTVLNNIPKFPFVQSQVWPPSVIKPLWKEVFGVYLSEYGTYKKMTMKKIDLFLILDKKNSDNFFGKMVSKGKKKHLIHFWNLANYYFHLWMIFTFISVTMKFTKKKMLFTEWLCSSFRKKNLRS